MLQSAATLRLPMHKRDLKKSKITNELLDVTGDAQGIQHLCLFKMIEKPCTEILYNFAVYSERQIIQCCNENPF